MSWSFSVIGNSDVIGTEFDRVRDQAASNGMPEGECRDLDEVRDFAMQIASTHGECLVNTNGHWNVFGADDPRNGLGQIIVSISKAVPKAAVQEA